MPRYHSNVEWNNVIELMHNWLAKGGSQNLQGKYILGLEKNGHIINNRVTQIKELG